MAASEGLLFDWRAMKGRRRMVIGVCCLFAHCTSLSSRWNCSSVMVCSLSMRLDTVILAI